MLKSRGVTGYAFANCKHKIKLDDHENRQDRIVLVVFAYVLLLLFF